MEDYPHPYVAHSRPLIVLAGLSRSEPTELPPLLSNGSRVGAGLRLPPLESSREENLREAFMHFDLSQGANHDDSSTQHRPPSLYFLLKPRGRTFCFPCRKASPLASEVGSPPPQSGSAHLHSPLSPLTKGSPVYGGGIMTPLWPMKYHDAVPAVIIFFLPIGFDAQKDILLQDNHLKTEINSMKTNLTDSHYKTKITVVLVGESSMRECSEVEERLTSIRKAVKLDSKTTFFYVPPEVSSSDLASFAESVLSALRSVCAEFYKAQYKQARRKKDKRGDSNPSSPSTEGVPQDLPRSGWNVRYEYKMGVFSEFRLEPEAAARHYKEVIDLLMEPGGVFDSNASFSSRLTELRLLADSSALRRIRCLLLSGLPTAAAKFWDNYCGATLNLLESKGKGSATYSWHAWVSRLARCMAEIIQSSFNMVTDSAARKSLEVLTLKQKYAYAPAEKSPQSDVLRPWHLLHHPGYWLYLSARYAERRKISATTIPSEDLVPPSQSPATNLARRRQNYDTYLCPEPHVEGQNFDHAQDTLQILKLAIEEFSKRDQSRMADRLRYSAGSNVKTGSTTDGNMLYSLWQKNTWRKSGWNLILQNLAYDLLSRSRVTGDFLTQVLMVWELLSTRSHQSHSNTLDLDGLLEQASDAISTQNPKSVLNINDEDISSFLDLDFVFQKESENLGEELRAQAILRSNARDGSRPVTLSDLVFTFDGNLPSIHIRGSTIKQKDDDQSAIHEVEILEATPHEETSASSSLLGNHDLTIFPNQTLVMLFSLPLRESGKISALKAMAVLERPNIRLEYTKYLGAGRPHSYWHVMRRDRLCRQRRSRWTSCREVNILPKLPKLKVRFTDLADQYYVGERTLISIELINDETWTIDGSIHVRLSASSNNTVQPKLLQDNDSTVENASDSGTLSFPLEQLSPSASTSSAVTLQMPPQPSDEFNLEVEVQYNGGRDKDSKVSKTISSKLTVVEPLQASFTVSPELHSDPWPSYFDIPETDRDEQWSGLRSRWNLQVNLVGLAEDALSIEDVQLSLLELDETASSSIISKVNRSGILEHEGNHEVLFQIEVSRRSLDDTFPANFDPTLSISWRRANSTPGEPFQKVLAAPRLALPTSEPRVIATRVQSGDETVVIDLHLENPSMHFLSFEYGISSSEEFGFSGSTLATAHLVPMSRHTVRYTLVPLVRGAFITPMFKVLDVFYNKSLRVHAGNGLRRESGGNLLLWIDSNT